MIYLDNASTTKVKDAFVDIITRDLRNFGNPSNHYQIGFENKKIIEEAREMIAKSLNCEKDEIYFTSGASEGNAWALKQKKRILCSPYEHHNIINHENAIIVGEDYLESAVKRKNQGSFMGNYKDFLYSHMFVNNETGEIFDIKKFGTLTHQLSTDMIFHVDMTQALGKVPIDFSELRRYVDIATFSGHKIHAPKGVGFIWFNKDYFNGANVRKIQPLIYGGGQESGLRAGTENVPYIEVLGMAVQDAVDDVQLTHEYCALLKQFLIEELSKTKLDYLIVSPANSITSTFAFCLKNVESELIQSMLADHEIYVGVGSACNTGDKINETDIVLQAMQIPEEYIHGLIRVSFSVANNYSGVKAFVDCLEMVCEELEVSKEE